MDGQLTRARFGDRREGARTTEAAGSWTGPARLYLVSYVNAPIADLPVKRILGGHHFVADLTLPYGRVLYDYLREQESPEALQKGAKQPRDVGLIEMHPER